MLGKMCRRLEDGDGDEDEDEDEDGFGNAASSITEGGKIAVAMSP
jgi:hypothetical protein